MVKSKVTGTVLTAKVEFEKDLTRIIREYVERKLIPQIQVDIRKLMQRTTKNWDGGREGSQGKREYYPPPKPDFKPVDLSIEFSDDGIKLEFNIDFDAKANGKISKLWYILDFGRPDGTWDKDYPSAWFLPQSTLRTIPNSLDVNPSRSYITSSQNDGWIGNSGRAKVENGLVYIRKLPGDEWGGIEPTNWSKLIAEEIQRNYSKLGFKVTYTRKAPV